MLGGGRGQSVVVVLGLVLELEGMRGGIQGHRVLGYEMSEGLPLARHRP